MISILLVELRVYCYWCLLEGIAYHIPIIFIEIKKKHLPINLSQIMFAHVSRFYCIKTSSSFA